jgi:hypothetical protein
VLGPIGAGKTTFSERLKRETGDTVLHIDGDKVGGSFTEFLGSERSDASKAAIYKCILQGKHPLFSTGGGVLDGFNVRQKLTSIFQREVKVVLCIMKDVSRFKSESDSPFEIKEMTHDEMEQQISEIYGTDVEYMKRVVEGRIERNEWKKTNEFAKINEKSQKNAKFASQLAKQANHIFTIPYDTSPESREDPRNMINKKVSGIERISKILKIPFLKDAGKMTGNFSQVRAVVSRSDPGKGMICKHFTMQYDYENICADSTIYDLMKEKICGKATFLVADLYKLSGKCVQYPKRKPVEIRVSVIRDCNYVKYAHVTELCAQFKPELMKQVTKHIHDFEETARNHIDSRFKLPSWDASSKSNVDFEFELTKQIDSQDSNSKKNIQTSGIQTKDSNALPGYHKDQVEYNFVDILLL